MPRPIRMVTLLSVLAVAGCSTSLTDPPSGLPVTMSGAPGNTPAPVFAASGDSAYVTVATESISYGCANATLDAGLVGTTLVTTITRTERTDVLCAAILLAASSRITVHHVPSGHYTHQLNLRIVPEHGDMTEHEVARGDVVVP